MSYPMVGTFMLFTLFFVLAAAAIVQDEGAELWKYRRLTQDGMTGLADTVDFHDQKFGKGTARYMTYSYVVHGKSYVAEERLGSPNRIDLLPGERLEILYDRADPGHSMAGDHAGAEKRYGEALGSLAFDGGLFGLASGGLLFFLVRRFMRERHLLKWGQAAEATITMEEERRGRSGSRANLVYEFRDEAGRRFAGERQDVPLWDSRGRKFAERLSLTTRPVVLYDPDDPERNDLYPLKRVELRG